MPERKAAPLPPEPWRVLVSGLQPRIVDARGASIVGVYNTGVIGLFLRAPGVEAAARELIGAMDRLDYAGNPERLLERLRMALGEEK